MDKIHHYLYRETTTLSNRNPRPRQSRASHSQHSDVQKEDTRNHTCRFCRICICMWASMLIPILTTYMLSIYWYMQACPYTMYMSSLQTPSICIIYIYMHSLTLIHAHVHTITRKVDMHHVNVYTPNRYYFHPLCYLYLCTDPRVNLHLLS